VEKVWVSAENIEVGTIRLYRYNTETDEWTPLPSKKIGEDANYLYFSAESPGFSVFTITGSRIKPVESSLSLLVGLMAILGSAGTVIVLCRLRKPRG
jgi:hypothetical protein